MPKRKYIHTKDFNIVFAEDWKPVVLKGEAMPAFARAIPDAIRCCIIASGQYINTRPYSSRLVSSGYLVGGMDIYRHAPDDPVPLNKDWYAIVSSDDPDVLVVDGPYKDNEHWLSNIPSRYQGAKVIGSAEDEEHD
jgi:hypothetical protein